MNRLILIGNGFDLAHGIKTSYTDFISDYLLKALQTYNIKGIYSDPLLELRLNFGYPFMGNPSFDLPLQNVINYVIDISNHDQTVYLNIKAPIIQNLLRKTNQTNWVDLETEYFKTLLEAKRECKNNHRSDAIQAVNKQLDFLKLKLTEYLSQQQSLFSNSFNKKPFVDCFTEIIQAHEVVTTVLEENQLPKNLFFLNFNYTNTFESYFDACRKKIASEFDYIHGNLGSVHGDPIFGFGDELDKNYLEFEDEKNNELFKHIKSFEYLKNKNYYRLIRFIESEDYQVQIYGHSCGLSDRTMLNQIFEHKKCKSIKIFYHQKEDGTNDYTEKTYEISRHFKNKGMMRKKIIPLAYSRAMPQPIF